MFFPGQVHVQVLGLLWSLRTGIDERTSDMAALVPNQNSHGISFFFRVTIGIQIYESSISVFANFNNPQIEILQMADSRQEID
ncbi:hypothetical protein B9Z49_00300 [Limnohabitans sp. 2KL-51]|nr:hypothetical protein B9Z49_00300 [Limnohabitans sp. 2KL-51]